MSNLLSNPLVLEIKQPRSELFELVEEEDIPPMTTVFTFSEDDLPIFNSDSNCNIL